MSTADTEIFLLSGLLISPWYLKPTKPVPQPLQVASVWKIRMVMIGVASVAVLISIFYSGLVEIYTWLLSALLVISPPLLLGLFIRLTPRVFALALVGGLILFGGLALSRALTVESAYLIVIPGFAAALLGSLVSARSTEAKD